MHFKRLIIFCLLISFADLINAQYTQLPYKNYSQKEYGQGQEAQNWAVVQDNRGFLYFGNSNGILEFDGVNWKFIPVKTGAFVTSLACDQQGRIYVGSQNEFGFLTPDKSGQLVYHSLSASLPQNEMFFSTIWKTYAVKDKIYFQSEEALFIYYKGKIKTIYPETSFHLSFLINNELYIRQRETGLMKLQNDALVLMPKGDFFADKGVFALLPFDKESFLAATFDQGLWIYNPLNGDHQEFVPKLPSKLKTANIYGGIVLHDNLFAFNTINQGLLVFNQKGDLKLIFNRDIGLKVNDIKQIIQDRNGNIWMALDNGISKLEYLSSIAFYQEKNGILGNVYAINKLNGKVYLGTSSGLFIQESSPDILKFSSIKGISNQVWSIIVEEGDLLIGSTDGLYVLKGETPIKVHSINAYSLKYDEISNTLFVGGNQGLATFSKKAGNWVFDKHFTDIQMDIKRIAINRTNKESSPEIWLGSSYEGLFRIKFKDDKSYTFDRYSVEDGLNEGYTLPFESPEGILFASKNGFLKFIDEESVRANLPDSLKDNPDFYKGYFDFYSFSESTKNKSASLLNEFFGNLFFVLDNKISFINEKKSIIEKPFRSLNYGKINVLFTDNQNEIWIGSDDGLVSFKISKSNKSGQKINSWIRKISTLKDSVLFFGNYITKKTTANFPELAFTQSKNQIPVLSHAFNSLTFEFVSNFLEYPEQTEFSYILEPYNSTWSSWNPDKKVNFTNLYEGEYRFKVKSRNVYGEESEIDTFEFVILPPWYRTKWAYLIYFLTFVLITFVLVRLGQMRLKRKNEQLERIVELRTTEIRDEKEKSDKLLLNTLPLKVVNDLKKYGKTEPESFKDVTVYFSDVVGFTDMSSTLDPKLLIKELNDIFTAFDDIMEKYHCERIKTIGDAYMSVCGMPEPDENHAEKMILASIEILKFLEDRNSKNELQWKIRIGINSGKVVGGIVGVKKYIYDVFGDAINTASRMESNGEAMKINVSLASYNILKDKFRFIERPPLEVKGKGVMNMYFLELN